MLYETTFSVSWIQKPPVIRLFGNPRKKPVLLFAILYLHLSPLYNTTDRVYARFHFEQFVSLSFLDESLF